MTSRRRRSLVVVSVLLLAAGAVLATVARPAREVSATLSDSGGAPLVLAGPDVLTSHPGPVLVRASGPGPVLVAVGRTGDVAAWAQGAAVTTATGLDGDGGDGDVLSTTATPGQAQVPDPSGSDLWTAQARGTGSAELSVDPTTGAPGVLVASDGAGPAPGDVELVWTHRPVPATAWVLLGSGALLAAWLLRSRRRRTPVTVDPPPDHDQPAALLPVRGRRSAR